MAIPGESEYIYGFHDPGNWRGIFTEQGRTAWVLVTEEIGYDPNAHSGPNYTEWSDAGFGVLVRLNNGYSPGGTIPHSRNYDAFAGRCANHVGDSRGAHIWLIGNEMNHANEQPGVRFSADGFTAEELITPDKYAACFKKVRDAIKAVRGHESDQVVLGAVAPYTAVLRYPGNEAADWIKYFTDILRLLGTGLDGIALHTYTHGSDPNLIFDEKQPWPQYPGLHYHFRAYRDFMKAIPANLRHLPIYITETDQSDDGQGHILPWADANSGWVRNAYKEINDWNNTPGNQQIRCLLLYRWGRFDDWYIEGKRGVIDDVKMAAQSGYKWNPAPPAGGQPFASANDNLNVRNGPSAQFDRVGVLAAGATIEVVGRNADNTWLQIAYPDANGRGWISAQFATVAGDLNKIAVVGAPPITTTPAPAKPAATAGERLNVRDGPGTQFNILGRIDPGSTYEITGRNANNAWLQIAYPDPSKRGWISAQFASVSGNLGAVPVIGAPTPTPTPPTRPAATTTDIVNARSGPGTTFSIVSRIPKGTKFDILGRNADNTWLQIPYPNANARAWISAQFASVSGNLSSVPVVSVAAPPPPPAPPAKPTATTTDIVNARTGPGTTFNVVGRIPNGTKLDIVGRNADNTWLQVPYPNGNSRAWITAQFASVSGNLNSAPVVSVAAPPPPPAPPAKPTATTTDIVNARTGPGTTFNVVGRIPNGTKLDIVGRTADTAWLQVPYPNANSRAWITAQFASVSGNLSSAPVISVPAPQPPPGDQLVVGGFVLSGDFLKFYRAHQQATGAPISNVVTENGVQTQYFEATALQAAPGGARPAPIGREVVSARRTIAELQSRVARLSGGSDFAPQRFGFDLQEVSATLPVSSDKKWPKRALSEIAYIVIQHTGAASTLSLADLTRQMIDNQDKPGMRFHFYIAADGTVYQTLPFDALTDHAAGQSRTSLGVALAGNFVGSALPSDAQISSAGELCAWLRARFNLPESRVKGMSEIVPTFQSPGDQWLKGANWKERLMAVSDAVIDSLRGQLPLSLTVSVPQPKWIDRTNALITYNKLPPAEKKQGNTLNYPTRSLDSIRYLVVHHSGAAPATTVEQIADYQVRTQTKDATGKITKEQWPGIGYHFFVNADGTIIKCNELTTVCYHVSGQNPVSVGICFAGNFNAGGPPGGVQLAAGGQLIAYLMDQLNLELDAVKGHKELEAVDDPGQWTDGVAWKHMLLGTIGAQLTLSA